MKILALLLWASVAFSGEPNYYTKGTAPPTPPKNPTLYAAAYGHCTWDSTHDVAACINSAIAKAAAAGGGTIMIPCGTYGLSSQVENHTMGVRLQGCGVGLSFDTADSSHFISATRLLWIGSVTASPALLVQTAAGGGTVISSADVEGVTVDCNNICGTAIRISGVLGSRFSIGASEATTTNIEFTTPTDLEAAGNQRNEIWAVSRSTSATNSPTGILFDGGCTACFNTSYNIIHVLATHYRKGDGIVFGGSDNNLIERMSDNPHTGATGSPVVFANDAYVMPNGVATHQFARAFRVLHEASHGVHITGFQTGSTFTATGGNAGTAALNPLTIATSIDAAASISTLTFASTTGAANEESVSCGGPVNGLFNGTPVGNVTATTVNFGLTEFIGAVAAGTNCTFTYGVRSSATYGTYTLTATSSTLYTLTAPSGGHTQTGIAASGGFLTFTDILIPWTGTPSTNDSWTIVVPRPANQITLEFIDKENLRAQPTFEAGTTGSFSKSTRGYPVLFGQQCFIGTSASGTAAGTSACAIGGEGNIASGEASVAVGGTGSTASGFAAFVTGQSNTSSGIDSVVGGFGNTGSGSGSIVMGVNGKDRGRYASNCTGGNDFAAQGDAQICYAVLRGTGATGSAIRLTGNAVAADGTSSCYNLPNNTAYAITIDITAFDHTTVTKFASWNALTGLLTRGANAASTAIVVASATPAVTYSGGSLVGNAMSITADTTNGCLNISWTPPTSNTDTWNVVAKITSVEVQ